MPSPRVAGPHPVAPSARPAESRDADERRRQRERVIASLLTCPAARTSGRGNGLKSNR